MHTKELIEFGLSEKEANVYTSLLEMEIATVQEIAKKTKIPRTSSYVVLESLKKKGLVSISDDKKVQQYVATSPEIFLNVLKERLREQEHILKSMEVAVPSLKALHKDTKHKPKVLVYEGENSVKQAYYELSPLNFKDDLRVFENPALMARHLPGFLERDITERKKKGVKMFAIHPNTKESVEIGKISKKLKPSDEISTIPVQKFKHPNQSIDFAVYGDETSFASLEQSFVITIKNQEIADTLKNIFDLAWAEAKRLSKDKK